MWKINFVLGLFPSRRFSFLASSTSMQPLPYFSSAKPDKTTSLAGQVKLYCRRRKARKTTDRLKMRLKIFKPITKRGDAQNTYTKFLLVFNLVVAEQIASCCYSVRSTDISSHHQLIIVKKPVLYELVPENWVCNERAHASHFPFLTQFFLLRGILSNVFCFLVNSLLLKC